MPPLSFLSVNPTAKHTATVIFAHGLGDTGAGWLPVAKMLAPALPHVKWILPNSPVQRVTLAGGMKMPAWFDLATLDKLHDPTSEDKPGMLSSSTGLQSLILQNSLDLEPHRVVVGGFSQGCAISLIAGLTDGEESPEGKGRGKDLSRQIGGVLALSGWLPLRTTIANHLHASAKDIPILWCHGKEDPTVPYEAGRRSVEVLREQLGFKTLEGKPDAQKGLRMMSYDGLGHSSSPQEIDDIASWLSQVLPPI